MRSDSSSHSPVATHRQPHPTPRQDTGGLIISETSGVATEELLRLVEQATVAVVQKQQQHPLLSTFASLSTTEQHATMHHNASLTTSLVVPLSLVFSLSCGDPSTASPHASAGHWWPHHLRDFGGGHRGAPAPRRAGHSGSSAEAAATPTAEHLCLVEHD